MMAGLLVCSKKFKGNLQAVLNRLQVDLDLGKWLEKKSGFVFILKTDA